MEYEIHEELAGLHRKLSPLELEQLEQNIVDDGSIRDPIAVWGKYLLDGRNRLDIAKRRGLQYKVVEVSLASLEEAKRWVISNQLGKRNLSEAEMTKLRVEKAKLDGAQEAADAFDVSKRTIQRDLEIDRIKESMPKALRDRIDGGTLMATNQQIRQYGKLTDAQKAGVHNKLAKQKCTFAEALPDRRVNLSEDELKELNNNNHLTSTQKRQIATGTKHASGDGVRRFQKLSPEQQEIVSELLSDEDCDSLDDAIMTLEKGVKPKPGDDTRKISRIKDSIQKKLEECMRYTDDLRALKTDKSGHKPLMDGLKACIDLLEGWR